MTHTPEKLATYYGGRATAGISALGEVRFHDGTEPLSMAALINTAKGERWFCTDTEARAAGWRRSKR